VKEKQITFAEAVGALICTAMFLLVCVAAGKIWILS
jgi:hypothetical protein